MIRKLVASIVLLIMVASVVPLALAMEDTQASDEPIVTRAAKVQQERAAVRQAIANTRQAAQEQKEGLKDLNEQRKELIQDHVTDRKSLREVLDKKEVKAQFKRVKKSIKELRDQRSDLKNKFSEARDNVRTFREEVKQCAGEACAEKRQQLRGHFDEQIMRHLELLQNSLDKVADRVTTSTVEPATQRRLLEEIDSLQAAVDAQITSIPDYEDAKELSKDVKALWKETHKKERAIVKVLLGHSMENVISKVDKEFRNGLQLRIDELQDANKDTASLEALLDEFDAKSVLLKKAKLNWENEHGELAEVRAALNEVKSVLRAFLTEYRELKA